MLVVKTKVPHRVGCRHLASRRADAIHALITLPVLIYAPHKPHPR